MDWLNNMSNWHIIDVHLSLCLSRSEVFGHSDVAAQSYVSLYLIAVHAT